MDTETMVDLGAVLVAVIIAVGMVVLLVLGRPVDGLSAGFLAVLGFFYGGSLVKSTAGRMTKAIGESAVNAINATTASTHSIASDAHSALSTVVNPPADPNNG